MGNVDGVPLASQAKSAMQASQGQTDEAWATQRRFSERCIGAAQVRSVVQAVQGDMDAAGETQRVFFENSQRLLNRSDAVDAVPLVSQFKAVGHALDGDMDAAAQSQRNFTRRCPVVSQARSVVEAVTQGPEEAIETQREFLNCASRAVDHVPLLGHAKGWLHLSLGDHERGRTALGTASASSRRAQDALASAASDIFDGGASGARQPRAPSGGGSSSSAPHLDPHLCSAAGPLSEADLREHTVCFAMTAECCSSHKACPICMEDFAVGMVSTTLRCLHVFHAECAETWLRQSGNCPVCRIAVKSAGG